MTKIELSTIEEFLSIAKDCKELSIYEYYNGFHCTIDSKEYLLIERLNDPTFSFYEYQQIIFSSVYLFIFSFGTFVSATHRGTPPWTPVFFPPFFHFSALLLFTFLFFAFFYVKFQFCFVFSIERTYHRWR